MGKVQRRERRERLEAEAAEVSTWLAELSATLDVAPRAIVPATVTVGEPADRVPPRPSVDDRLPEG